MIYEYLLLALLIINLFPWHKILTHLCSDEKLIIPSSLIVNYRTCGAFAQFFPLGWS